MAKWERPAWLAEIWEKLHQNHLWQRMTKHTIAVTIAFTIVIIPAVSRLYGSSAFLAPMTTVFGHSGRRLGEMIESLVFILAGAIVGTGWSILGLYLSSLVYAENSAAAYTIKAIFMLLIVVFHGYFRSQSPRLFTFLWICLITSFTALLGTTHYVTLTAFTQIFYPILTAFGVLLVVGFTVFPEFSSDFLGAVTIEALCHTEATLDAAIEWIVEPKEEEKAPDPDAEPRPESAEHGDNSSEKPKKPTRVARLAALTAAKGKLRSELGNCKKAFEECTYELTYSVLPPRNLKPISKTVMSGLVRNVITLISACESKFALVGECHGKCQEEAEKAEKAEEASDSDSSALVSDDDSEGGSTDDEDDEEEGSGRSQPNRQRTIFKKLRVGHQTPRERVNLAKPKREIASGDAELLESVLSRVRDPVSALRHQVSSAIRLLIMSLAYCYDVRRLPTGALAPKGIMLEEIDIRLDLFDTAITSFDKCSMEALGRAASMEEEETGQLDIMPRTETFLISSVLLSYRQAAVQTMQMLKHARKLVEKRQQLRARKRLHLPRKFSWKKWLSSAGEHDAATLPQDARKEARTGKGAEVPNVEHHSDDEDSGSEEGLRPTKIDEEACVVKPPAKPIRRKKQPVMNSKQNVRRKDAPLRPLSVPWWREKSANVIESIMESEHLAYALKLAVAVFLVSFPAFHGPWNSWYAASRASWAPLQLVLVFEVAIGSSFWIFVVRAFGVAYGCIWGFIAYEVCRGYLPPLVVVLVVGIVPAAYVQLATPYVKAGMIAIVSMCVVALATVQQTNAPWQIFLKRMAAFMVGGAVAILVEMILFPVKARDRLVESLSSCLRQISHMEAALAAGIENPTNVTFLKSGKINARFNRAKEKAQSALAAGETFLPFCSSEPRLKGSFSTLEPIYKEICYVLHQIIDRMDNMISLRQAYGSSVLEDLNKHVYPYRRNVAGSITLTVFAVNEALSTKMPMPQYLPSCRQAQTRLVHKVREVLQSGAVQQGARRQDFSRHSSVMSLPKLDEETIRRVTEPKVLSWNAAAAGQMEIIEYLEELVELTKFLVGVNAFQGGMLDKLSFHKYNGRMQERERALYETSHGERGGDLEAASSTSRAGEGSTLAEDEPPMTMKRRMSTFLAGKGEPRPQLLRQKSIPKQATSRRKLSVGVLAEGEAARVVRSDLDDLPASLQRVGTRIRQERDLLRRMTTAESKGKDPGR